MGKFPGQAGPGRRDGIHAKYTVLALHNFTSQITLRWLCGMDTTLRYQVLQMILSKSSESFFFFPKIYIPREQ